MNTLMRADLFFFITSIAVVILTIVLCIIGYYVVLIVRDAKYITGRLREATDELSDKIEEMKDELTAKSRKARYVVEFFLNRFLGKKK